MEPNEPEQAGPTNGSGGPPRRIRLDWLRAPLLGCVVVFPLVILVVFLRWWLEWAITPIQLGLGLTVAYAVAWKTAQIRIERDEAEADPSTGS